MATDQERIDAFKGAADKNRNNGGNVALRAVDFCWLVDHAAAEFDRQAAAAAAEREALKPQQKAAAAEKRNRKRAAAEEEQETPPATPAKEPADPNDPLAVNE